MSMRQLKITKSITNRESQSLEKYLQEIGKVELITPEEEVALAIRIKHGDEKQRDANQTGARTDDRLFVAFGERVVPAVIPAEEHQDATGQDEDAGVEGELKAEA